MVRILLRFSEQLVKQPITSQVILQYKIPVNIITASIDSKSGEILAEVPESFLDKAASAFPEKGAKITIPDFIEVDREKCFCCGACTSLCPVEAIVLAPDSSVVFDSERCVGSTCGLCVDSCPARAITSKLPSNS
ncbi:4Fe-4S binding protein [Candidatus Bathyarchaeota archaeon]|nr:4Fe-4S binding protein [Candidatus Bathyarchaeota archaeon]